MPRVDKISTVPRGYCRNRLARPNSQACTRISVQPGTSVLVSVRAHLERCLKKTLVAKRDPREPARMPKLARSRKIKIKIKIKNKIKTKRVLCLCTI